MPVKVPGTNECECSRLANHRNKLVHSHSFVYLICKLTQEIYPYNKLKIKLIYILRLLNWSVFFFFFGGGGLF